MKIYCETCEGSGFSYGFSERDYKECLDCFGKGYTMHENQTIEINTVYFDDLKAKAHNWDNITNILFELKSLELSEVLEQAKIGKALLKSIEKEFGIFQWTEYAGAPTNWYPMSEDELNRLLDWFSKLGG